MDTTGRRVTVRHRLPRSSAGHVGRDRFADVVGDLVTGPDGAVVVRADGTRVPVRPERVAAVRDVDTSATRTRTTDPAADAAALDRLAAAHWRATTEHALGQWRLRGAGGFTRRANSALAVGDPGIPVPDALDRVTRWYGGRDLPPRVSCADPDLVAAAVAVGWTQELTTTVMTARVADVLGALPDGWADGGPTVRVDADPAPAWLADYRGADRHPDGAAVLRAPAGTTGFFATAQAPVGTTGPARVGLPARGRGVVSDGWVGLSCLGVDPALRRRGLGRVVVATLLDAALDAGAVRAYLQVETTEVDAVAFHRSVGFADHHTTVYLRPPS